MANNNVPNPQNILSITYQLLQEVGDPASIRAQLPKLTIQFQDGDSVVRNKIVGFEEMLPYLRYLHVKALSLGKVIVSIPESTFDKKIVFLPGEPEAETVPSVVTIITPNGLIDADFTLFQNFSSVLGNVLQASNTPAFVGFSLPVINGSIDSVDVFEDYDFTTSAGAATVRATNDGVNWGIDMMITNDDPQPNAMTVTVTAKTLKANLFVVNGSHNTAATFINAIALAQAFQNVGGGGYVDQGNNLFINDIPIGNASALRVIAGQGTGTFSGTYVAASATDGVIFAVGKKIIATPFNIPASGQVDTPFDYDFRDGFGTIILFYPGTDVPPTPGVVTNLKLGVASGSICAQPTVSVYTNDGNVTTGKTLYDDPALTVPHAGATFASNVVTGITYNVNPVTGVVGAVAGVTCNPANSPKTLFVVNSSGVAIVVTTDIGSFPFAPGVNGNVSVSAQGLVKNDSLTARTFKFLQALPSTLDPQIALPNPKPMAVGAQVNLSANVSNLNYLIVT